LQMLGPLMEHVLGERKQCMNVVVATSGDTGPAAIEGLRGKKGIRVFVLFPKDGTSDFQRRQMSTVAGEDVYALAISGAFDDCQAIMKEINADAPFKELHHIGGVNSTNFARIVLQIAYYFWAFFKATQSDVQRVMFAVPTGNFGDIYAGYLARQMGLPIEKLILASNENDVLPIFFNTREYRPRPAMPTSSPSMDINQASNFERLAYDLLDQRPKVVGALWRRLREEGAFTLPGPYLAQKILETGIVAGSSNHVQRIGMIRLMRDQCSIVVDPHTAAGLVVGLSYRQLGVPLICLATAAPAKFASTIREALGTDPEIPKQFAELADREEHFVEFSVDTEAVKRYIAAHALR